MKPGTYKILLIDDRYENLLSLSAVLNKSGYVTDTALSGKEGLELLLKNKYGLMS
jgi:CheY-like chemotaxis protein